MNVPKIALPPSLFHYDLCIMGENESKNDQSEDNHKTRICGWCKKIIFFEVQHGTLICHRCYDLLINAGVSQEEIVEKTQTIK